MNNELQKEMNAAYYSLEQKNSELVHAFSHRIFKLESGWYSGHYHKDETGNWQIEFYPIPVIDVKGICDMEIHFVFPFDTDKTQIFEFVKLLRREGFYY